MSAFKTVFLLSLLAIFLAPRQSEAQATINSTWTTFSKCAQVTIESVTNLANRAVPRLYELKACSAYVAEAPENGKETVLWYLRVGYEFLKKVVRDKSTCLIDLMYGLAAQIKPYANQIATLRCLAEDDFLF